MALATNSTPGEIQLAGDLAGDGGVQSGSNPQLTHLPGLTAGQYPNAKVTIDAKGRVTAVESTSSAEVLAKVPAATTTTAGTVMLGDNIYVTGSPTAGYQEVNFSGLISGASATGLANDSCSEYSFTVIVDGGDAYTVTESGDNLQTITEVIAAIEAQVPGTTTTVESGNLRITSDETGKTSSIAIQSPHMFSCMTSFSALSTAVAGTDSCEIYVPDASDSVAGVVQIGSGINVTDGVISITPGAIPTATTTVLGGVIVPTSGHIDVDGSGNISVPVATESSIGVMQVGTGLDVDVNGVVSVDFTEVSLPDATEASKGIMQVGTGLDVTAGVVSVDISEVTLPIATESSTGVMQVGAGLDVDINGVVSVDISEVTLPDATTSTKGVVQVGSGLAVASGVVSATNATTSTKGVVQVGSGLAVASGVLSLGVASAGALGGIKVGAGLSIDGSGILSADAVPDATESSKGIMQVGTGLDVTAGVVSVDISEVTLPDATTSTKGVVQVGTNIDVVAGVISVPDATTSTKGVVQVGSGLAVASGVITPATATNSTLGVVKVADTTHITIDGAGGIDVGSDVALKDVANTFTAGQAVSLRTLTSGTTISVNAALSNTFVVTLGHNATLANPTNLVAGQTLVFIIKQDGTGGRTLAFGTNYKFRYGTVPFVSPSANAKDIMTCIFDGTSLYCSYNKDFS